MLGMAGIAEAAFAIELMFSWFGLMVVMAGMAVAFLTNSRTWHIVAAILAASYGLVMAPWEIPFVQLTPDELEDPDIEMWLNRFRTLAYTCYAVALVAIANITQYLIRAPQHANSQEPIPGINRGQAPEDDKTTKGENGQPP